MSNAKVTANINDVDKRRVNTVDMVRTYLQEIGKVPLLSHEQEIVFGKQVQHMMSLYDVKESLEKKLGREITLEEWAQKADKTPNEVKKIIHQGKRAKQKMIEANLRLVVAIAKKYQKRNMEFLDLIQEGSLGLERGVEKFDPTKGFKFSTYAYWWIRQAITRAIAQQARTIRLPIHITEKLNKIKKTQRELSQKLGRSPSPNEIAEALQLEPAQIREYFSIARQPISLDVKVGDNQDTELSELLEDEGVSPDNYITQELMRQDLQKLLGELTPQQQQVVRLRFGLEDGKELSLAKIGQRMNISRERVRQLEQQALAHLRKKRSSVKEYIVAS
ncbi:RNA polymerase sigma factor, RpoD/SigA family [Cyanobacterium sp. Dongsha4]|uniref:RNA polymerase sigma factor, RpoD/SigA family n=1 Tax=Cyanobacterium sp. DS4 TaxID=2878255 RepID=UPI002E82376F|nr:RNA polymerase sigma factor, RpoD/SigA family [Cyanobacterium sp. Dongsha4]WVK99009.1 RNA polymerase sigma factor, RpoD/SigA family [Cyanobacterium sp. Dongsha4]